MNVTVEINEARITELVRQRIGELFSDDSRFRETPARDLIRRLTDEAAVSAIKQARDKIADELPVMAEDALRVALKADMELAAKRGTAALRKLYAGFDPAKLLPEQRAWLVKQITGVADVEKGGGE